MAKPKPTYHPSKFIGFAAFVPDGNTRKAKFIYMEKGDTPEQVLEQMLTDGWTPDAVLALTPESVMQKARAKYHRDTHGKFARKPEVEIKGLFKVVKPLGQPIIRTGLWNA